MSTIPVQDLMKLTKETYEGSYEGRVIDRNDPLKQGRCKVEVMPMFKGLDVSVIPWATGIYQGNFLSVPEENSWVKVQFKNGDIDTPEMIGQVQSYKIGNTDYVDKMDFDKQEEKLAAANTLENSSIISGEPVVVRSPSYPDNSSMITKGGIIVEIDSTSGEERVHIKHPSGTFLVLTANGDIHIHSKNDTGIYSEGGIKVVASSGVEVIGNAGATPKGIVQGECICPFTGKPHFHVSNKSKADL